MIRYEITDNAGHFAVYPMERILHLRGLSLDGLVGISPIGVACESMGFAKATEEHGARLFSSHGRPGGILIHPAKLTPEAAKRLRDSWQASHAGLPLAHTVAVLEEGLSWHQVSMNAEGAQFHETCQYQLTEIARLFRIPPHMIGDLSRATFSNVEQRSLEFVVHTIRPWLVCWEQALSRSLLPNADRDHGYFIEFLVVGLLRGDIASRYQAYSIGRNNGWLSANDIRGLENMNPLPDRQGVLYLVPLNMVPAETLTNAPQVSPMIEKQATESQAPANPGKESTDNPPAERSQSFSVRRSPGVATRRKLKENYRRLFADSVGNQIVDLTIRISHGEVGMAGLESQSPLAQANVGHSESIASGGMDLGSIEINLTCVEPSTASSPSETISLLFQVAKSEPSIAEAESNGIPLERLVLPEELSSQDNPIAQSVVAGSLAETFSGAEILSASANLIAAILESANSNESSIGAYFLSILADLASKESSDVILTLRLDSIPIWIIRAIAALIKPTNAITVELNL